MARNSSGTFPSIVDYTPVSDDTDWTDNLVTVNVSHLGFTNGYTFSGLTANETYYFEIYPYTNAGIDINYKTDAVPTASESIVITPSTQASSISFSNVGSSSLDLNWTNGDGTSRIVIAKFVDETSRGCS